MSRDLYKHKNDKRKSNWQKRSRDFEKQKKNNKKSCNFDKKGHVTLKKWKN